MILPLVFKAADLSASTRSEWVRLPSAFKRACIGIGWTDVDSPTGTLSIEVSVDGVPGTAGAAYPITISTNPAGTSAAVVLDGIVTSAPYIAVVYTVTSGGTDDTFIGDQLVAGSLPTISITE
jgi:hypothetical protein